MNKLEKHSPECLLSSCRQQADNIYLHFNPPHAACILNRLNKLEQKNERHLEKDGISQYILSFCRPSLQMNSTEEV